VPIARRPGDPPAGTAKTAGFALRFFFFSRRAVFGLAKPKTLYYTCGLAAQTAVDG